MAEPSPLLIVKILSLRHIVAITGHLTPNAPLTRKLRSKGRVSPLYVLGRTSQDKPACHLYAHIENTHTQPCILSWNDDSAQPRSVKSHLSSEGIARLAVPSNLLCKSVPSANLAPEQLGTSDLTAASQSESVSRIMHDVCM
jgi:hypothetical protein